MGYGVYPDPEHDRWAGYMVPAECDKPGCEKKITRGMDYKCDSHAGAEVDGEYVSVEEGCGLFFCHSHLYDGAEHDGVEAKPDSGEWMRWMLSDDSWEQWRTENPERVATMRELVALLPPEEPDDVDDVQIAGRLHFRGDIQQRGMLLRRYDTARYGLTIPVDLAYDEATDLTTITLARLFVEATHV